MSTCYFPLLYLPFCFLKYSFAFSSALPAPLSHLITSQSGDKNYQSAVHKVHLWLCSAHVSTFFCTRVDINHLAKCGGTCCTPCSGPLTSLEWGRLISLIFFFFPFRFCSISITRPGPLHMIVLYWPLDSHEMNVSQALHFNKWSLKMVTSTQKGLFQIWSCPFLAVLSMYLRGHLGPFSFTTSFVSIWTHLVLFALYNSFLLILHLLSLFITIPWPLPP